MITINGYEALFLNSNPGANIFAELFTIFFESGERNKI